MIFTIKVKGKSLIFDSDEKGISILGKNYESDKSGLCIYDKIKGIESDEVTLQMSTNTSTLIPALRVLSLPYNPYFNKRDVIESQNNITFYWKKSKLAAYYNKFSTDGLEYDKREPVIRNAVDLLIKSAKNLPLNEKHLSRSLELCKLIGFYQGFPIFDSSVGFAKLQSRLGIHIDPESIMVSTPLDQYENDIYELARMIRKETGIEYTKKKNRVVFPKEKVLLNLLNLSKHYKTK